MFFTVQIGLGFPYSRYFSVPDRPVAIIQADSRREAAEKLGLIRWDGWKKVKRRKIPRGGIRQELAGKLRGWSNLYFTPFDTKRVDRNPATYETIERRIRVIQIEPLQEWKSPIPEEIWRQY